MIELDNFELSLEKIADNVLAASKGRIKEVAIVVTEKIEGEDRVRCYTHLDESELADLLLDALHIPEIRQQVVMAEENTLEFTMDLSDD